MVTDSFTSPVADGNYQVNPEANLSIRCKAYVCKAEDKEEPGYNECDRCLIKVLFVTLT